jgi:DNA-binding response OmpR family regulator
MLQWPLPPLATVRNIRAMVLMTSPEAAGSSAGSAPMAPRAEPLLALWSDDFQAARPWCARLAEEGLNIVPMQGWDAETAKETEVAASAQLLWLRAAVGLRLEWLRERRAVCGRLPLVLVGRGLRDLDAVLALEMGADEVLDADTVSPPLVAARLRALWRRCLPVAAPEREEPGEIVVGGLHLVLAGRQVGLAGRRIELSEGEFEVLWLLARRAGSAVARSEILRRVRGLEDQPLDRSIDSRVYRIRAKLGDRGLRIRTVRHFGYALASQDTAAQEAPHAG